MGKSHHGWFSRAVETLKFKLIIAFDGSAYHGWDSPGDGRGVRQAVEKALKVLLPPGPKLTSSSRTDAGVHALGLVAHFETAPCAMVMSLRHLSGGLNGILPKAIRIMTITEVGMDFHARFDAIGKQYRYKIWNFNVENPLSRTIAWHVPRELDHGLMEDACADLIGTHDFRSFTTNRGGTLVDSIRTVRRLEIKRSGARMTFIIEGDGFLYRMCRSLVGTIVQIGEGKLAPGSAREILAGKDRQLAGVCAPAHGLVLQKVFYPTLSCYEED